MITKKLCLITISGLFLFFGTGLHSMEIEESIDINEAIKNRSQQYPLSGYSKIWVVAAPRTGSTLIYNILRYLFKDDPKSQLRTSRIQDVWRVHCLPGQIREDTFYVYLTRDPINACFSHIRIRRGFYKNKPETEATINSIINSYMAGMRAISKLRRTNAAVLELRYEDFDDNFDCGAPRNLDTGIRNI